VTILETRPQVGSRTPTRRRYLVCRPEHFEVRYAINPWMDPDAPVDRALALEQWDRLVAVYEGLGHTVERIDPLPGQPDMVFAANGALVVGGRALGARFAYPERAAEAPAFAARLAELGVEVVAPEHVNEGEGDFVVVGERVLAGTGFRTAVAAHEQAAEVLGVEVVTLRLVDPCYYHLDTCLAALDGDNVAWYPEAFDAESQAVVRRLYPHAVEASEADARAFGLNLVSDGQHVVIDQAATGLVQRLSEAGYLPVPVDLSELVKAGGNVKCCTLELR
jgi:N-dimethylarginine dimethylaminohydrolase